MESDVADCWYMQDSFHQDLRPYECNAYMRRDTCSKKQHKQKNISLKLQWMGQ